MKNSKLVKVLLMALIAIMIASLTFNVFAADSDDEEYDDLGNLIGATSGNSSGNSSSGGNSSGNSSTSGNSSGNSSGRSSTIGNTGGNSALNTSAIGNNSTPTSNASLPKTGIGSSTSIIVLITIFGISSVYAYKKVREYKNL